MTTHGSLSSPGVRFPPPIIFVAGLLVGWILNRYVRVIPLPSIGSSAVEQGIAMLLVFVGIILAGWGIVTFRRARTTLIPNQGASQLVSGGPYRFTRNPMYTGLTIQYLGIAALLDSAWPILLLPLVLVVLVQLVITREEAYLRDAFGAEYVAYKARVRRWL
jgi:protein-S-isoprenylcysteine O-methyltransferase Ste14